MKGTPFGLKCPKCKRGKFRHPPQIRGVRPTGKCELRLTRSAHHAGCSGPGFYGHRGQVECLDCGHLWYSTHPRSGRQTARQL